MSINKAAPDVSKAKPTALVTGASLGIGLELAKILAADGHDLILVARSAAKLEALSKELRQKHGSTVSIISSDLSLPGAAKRLYDDVAALGLSVDVLINNAGSGQYGAFLELDGVADASMLQLNMIAPTELTRLFAPAMVQRRKGRIMNVASTAAFQPGPLMSTYFASKAYVLSFSEALANELKDSGVSVTALCPGPTRSGFQDQANMHGSRILAMGMMEASDVAQRGYKAMQKGKVVVITGASNWVLAESVRFTPRAVVTAISRYIAGRKTA